MPSISYLAPNQFRVGGKVCEWGGQNFAPKVPLWKIWQILKTTCKIKWYLSIAEECTFLKKMHFYMKFIWNKSPTFQIFVFDFLPFWKHFHWKCNKKCFLSLPGYFTPHQQGNCPHQIFERQVASLHQFRNSGRCPHRKFQICVPAPPLNSITANSSLSLQFYWLILTLFLSESGGGKYNSKKKGNKICQHYISTVHRVILSMSDVST